MSTTKANGKTAILSNQPLPIKEPDVCPTCGQPMPQAAPMEPEAMEPEAMGPGGMDALLAAIEAARASKDAKSPAGKGKFSFKKKEQ